MTERKRTEKEMREHCIARDVTGASCQYPDCGCFDATNYYEEHPEELEYDPDKITQSSGQ